MASQMNNSPTRPSTPPTTSTPPITSTPIQRRSSSSSSSSSLSSSSSSLPSSERNKPSTTPSKTSSKTSSKLRKLLEIRRASFKPNLCSYIITKGARRGEMCGKRCDYKKPNCNLHTKKPKVVVVPASEDKIQNPKRLRIHYLKLNHKYYFIRKTQKHEVILKCCDQYYILKLPRSFEIPKKGSKKYLIRDAGTKRTRWSC